MSEHLTWGKLDALPVGTPVIDQHGNEWYVREPGRVAPDTSYFREGTNEHLHGTLSHDAWKEYGPFFLAEEPEYSDDQKIFANIFGYHPSQVVVI